MLICDIDGVICDLMSEFMLRVSELVGVPLRAPWEITTHDSVIATLGELDDELKATVVDLLIGRPDYVYVSARPYFAGLKLLRLWWEERRGPINFVTSRGKHLVDTTRIWFERWVYQRGLCSDHTCAVHFEGSRDAKVEKMAYLANVTREPNVIVDDDPAVLTGVEGRLIGATRMILVPQPWNGYAGKGSLLDPMLSFLDEGAIVWR